MQETVPGLRWLLAKPKMCEEPATTEMLIAKVESVGPTVTLTEVRLLAVCLLALWVFFGCDELVKIVCKDIVFNNKGMVVNICSS